MEANLSDSQLENMASALGIDVDTLKQSRFFDLLKGVFPVYITNLDRVLAPFGGEIVSNLTSVTLVNNTLKQVDITVPAGKRWYLFGGSITNPDDVGRNCTIFVTDGTAILYRILKDQAIGATASAYFPNTEATVSQIGSGAYPLPLLAGYMISFYWAAGGASAGGVSASGAVAMVVEVDE